MYPRVPKLRAAGWNFCENISDILKKGLEKNRRIAQTATVSDIAGFHRIADWHPSDRYFLQTYRMLIANFLTLLMLR
jgi:hypothetical protein